MTYNNWLISERKEKKMESMLQWNTDNRLYFNPMLPEGTKSKSEALKNNFYSAKRNL